MYAILFFLGAWAASPWWGALLLTLLAWLCFGKMG